MPPIWTHFWLEPLVKKFSLSWLILGTLLSLSFSCGTGGESSPQNAQANGDENQDIVPEEGTAMRFDPAGLTAGRFFDLPFPDDLRRQNGFDGVFTAWPGAQSNGLLKLWFEAADELMQGWGLSSAIFAYFDAPLDPNTLPDAATSVDFSDGYPSIFLLDVEPESPEFGQTMPIDCDFRSQAGSYHDANQLSCLSPFGVVRRPLTRYALVLTDGLKDHEGNAIVASESMASLLGNKNLELGETTIDARPYQDALGVVEALGLDPGVVKGMVLLTTQDPSRRLRRINEWYRQLPTPRILPDDGIQLVESFDDYVVLQAYYEVPVIQEGNRPYAAPPAGRILFDEDGQIEAIGAQRIRFYLTIPRMEMPVEGFPVLFYFHGSGGVAEELINRGPKPDLDSSPPAGSGPAGVVAPYGIAGFAADFNLHGMRHSPRDTTGLQLYNLLSNPRAAVDNFIIGANEITLHARLIEALEFDVDQVDGLGELLPETLTTISFNPDGFAGMGQSMGSTIGLPALTIDDRIRAGIFSGSGGVLIEVALRSIKPINVGNALRAALRYRPDEELNRFDPILSAVQHVWDFVDPVSHARFVFLEPHEGVPAKHSIQHSGLNDGYFSPESRAAFSTALGTPLVAPLLEPEALDQMAWRNLSNVLPLPVTANVTGTTAVVTQYEPRVLDGHNVAFQREDAQLQYACFIRSLPNNAAPTLRTPENSYPDTCP